MPFREKSQDERGQSGEINHYRVNYKMTAGQNTASISYIWASVVKYL